MTPPLDVSMDGAWRELFPQALVLMDALHQANPLAQWRFGGGTVLMLRYRHRLSKDIDLFIDDPQLLGFVNPRLSEVAESITADYQEGAEFVKLLLPQGEIDVVVSPCLTGNAVEKVDIMGRPVLVETSTEIVAKKMYYRGNRAKARDLFDFALVLEKEPDALMLASGPIRRHRDVFLRQLETREQALRTEFEAIDTLEYRPSFEDCVDRVSTFLSKS